MPTDERAVGTIAQELQEIAPYTVTTWTYETEAGAKEEYLGVDYGAMDFVLINAVQEQQALIQQQQKALEAAQKELATYKASTEARLQKLEALLQQTPPSTATETASK